jgi:site-specific recombinase XerD
MMTDPRQTAAAQALIEHYRDWLVAERGLATGTIRSYVPTARLFLSECSRLDLQSLTLGEVNSFVVRECRRRSTGSAKNLVKGLRSLLRYLYLEGLTDRPLAPAVPTPAGWRDNLPRGLGADELRALLAEDGGAGPLGRRDHAIVVMLARLGLRAGEVAALGLDDVDWRAGEIAVRGKGNRIERLPLPVDVGESLVDYLREGRPRTACRALFLRTKPPVAGLSSTAIGHVVRRACVRAGVVPVGAHRLRHSTATQMLRRGASLDEVGQVLRDRSAQVVAVYAKIDFAQLRPLALAWPGGAA